MGFKPWVFQICKSILAVRFPPLGGRGLVRFVRPLPAITHPAAPFPREGVLKVSNIQALKSITVFYWTDTVSHTDVNPCFLQSFKNQIFIDDLQLFLLT